MPRSFQPIIELDVIIPLRENHSIKQQFIKFKSDPSTKLNLIAQIEANIDPDLLNTSDKWALMDEVISHYKTVNLEHLRGLIIVIHKCV
jgi:hypothetical protein